MERTNALAELAKDLGVVYAVANRGCTRETCIGKVVRKAKCIVAELAKCWRPKAENECVNEYVAAMATIRAIAEEGAGDGN